MLLCGCVVMGCCLSHCFKLFEWEESLARGVLTLASGFCDEAFVALISFAHDNPCKVKDIKVFSSLVVDDVECKFGLVFAKGRVLVV